jgi:hypothetical protein
MFVDVDGGGRGTRWLLRAYAFAAACVCTGCSILLLPDDLTGGAYPPEASADGAGVTGGEGGRGDGGSGAGPWDANAGPFCSSRAPAPTFCIDYDTSRTTDDRSSFHSVTGFNGGNVSELDHSTATSPSASLHLAVPAGVPGTNHGLTNRVAYDTPGGAGKSAHFECDMRVDSTDSTSVPYLIWLFAGAGSDASIALYVSRAESGVMQTPSYERRALSKAISLGVWTHVEMDVAFTASPAKITVKLDGAVVLDSLVLDPVFAGANLSGLSVGPAYYTDKSVEATEAHYDNVLVQHRSHPTTELSRGFDDAPAIGASLAHHSR